MLFLVLSAQNFSLDTTAWLTKANKTRSVAFKRFRYPVTMKLKFGRSYPITKNVLRNGKIH